MALTSAFLVTTLPSGSSSSAPAFRVVKPVPVFLGRSCSGFRFIVYSLPPYAKVRLTSVGVSGAAYLERNMPESRVSPLASPYSA